MNNADWTRNIRDYRNRATADMVRDGEDWYPAMLAIMRGHAAITGLTVAQCGAIYAANSINTPWQRNLELAARALADHADGRLPLVDGGTLGMVIDKVRAIIAANSDEELDNILSKDANNRKIKCFRRNLTGDYEAVTVDRWAFRIATNFADCPNGGNPCVKNGRHGCGHVPTGKEYAAMADAYREVATEFGENPATLQAITWCVVRGTGE